MKEQRRSLRQIKNWIYHTTRDALLEFNKFDADTPMGKRIRNSERIKVLNEIGQYVGISDPSFRVCQLPECNVLIAKTGGRRKYCSDACKMKAYRRRKKLVSYP